MNLAEQFSTLEVNVSKLTQKKQQTTKKIEYIREYVLAWASISAERKDVNTINFIDCMCNAGVYQDGDCCTAIEVLVVFADLCRKFPRKTFRLFLNDYDPEKIEVLRKVISFVRPKDLVNLETYIMNQDVNAYLDWLYVNAPVDKKQIFGYGASTVLFVDPFDFGTVEIPRVSAILQKHYCELIFNFFISDYVRNVQIYPERIAKCLGGVKITDKEELIAYMKTSFRVGSIGHLFAYQFKNINNVELYQIVFATPSIRGIEVLKDALWKVFNGAEFHRNSVDTGQLSMFSAADDKELCLQSYSQEAIEMLEKRFGGREVSYTEIEVFLIENTMLRESQIIKNVLKPMIASGKMTKCGLVNVQNYKKDYFRIGNGGANQ